MTIETTAIKAIAQGNGATVVWPFTFPIPAQADLIVSIVLISSGNTIVIAPASYTVSGFGNPAGGTVTYPLSGSPLSNLFKIVIERSLPLKQETDLLNQGGAYPSAIEDALDYLTMVTQQLQDQIDRAIVFSVADSVEVDLPLASARANKFLGFNANGDPVAVDGLTAGTTVSAAMIPVVTAPTTAAALVALGLPGALLDSLIPAGTIWDFAGTTAPTGFVLAFGQPCTGTYPVLRAILVAAGSPFGTNGVDPLFPDCRSRSLIGKSNMGGVDNGLWTGGTVLGAVAGAQTKTLLGANLPPYTPSGSIAGAVTSTDTILVNGGGVSSLQITGAGFGWSGVPTLKSLTTALSGGFAGTFTGVAQGGTSTPIDVRTPGLILNKIIKAH